MIHLRDYQQALVQSIESEWAKGYLNVMAVCPTGGGKTVVFSDILRREAGPSCAIAHRQELVSQMSVALARNGVRHRIIAPDATVKRIIKLQVQKVGRSYYDGSARCAVAGVDTLPNKLTELGDWFKRVQLVVTDEGHHVLLGNKWGRAIDLFSNARGLMVTATPIRADGRGLGRHADGLADTIVFGPEMRRLIRDGYLTDYRIFAPQSDLHVEGAAGSTGDWSPQQLRNAARKSHIIGDVVDHYLRICPGKLGVVFATDVETAKDIAARFNAAGIVAAAISAKTPDPERNRLLAEFERGLIRVLVNVDLFGEGFDLPAIEVVIMARPTESFALFCQQFGRALRLMLDGPLPETREGRLQAIANGSKPFAIIIDHVGNIVRHGLPDAPQDWALDARGRRSRGLQEGVIPLRACLNVECLAVYERSHPACPYCGHKPEPANRSAPEFVDGDLTELDPAVLARMRGEIDEVDKDPADYVAELNSKGCPVIGQKAHLKRHVARQEAQAELREAMAVWAGYQTAHGRSDAESYRRFYYLFGTDAATAQTLGPDDAQRLKSKIEEEIG